MISRVLFVGSKSLGLRCFEAMHRLAPQALVGMVTVDDREDARTKLDELVQAARRAQVPAVTLRKPGALAAAMADLQPELVIVSGWYWLVPQTLLAAVPHGVLGFHASFLPKYRGFAPVVWAMINGEPEVGLSLFSIVPALDEGDVWAQRSVAVGPHDRVGEVLVRLEQAAADILESDYVAILRGERESRRQPDGRATYGAMRIPADGVIDWSWPAARVHNWVRAQSEPYPGAFSFVDGRRVTVWRSHPAPGEYLGRPGQVVGREGDAALVLCGERGLLGVDEVQEDGGAREAGAAVLSSLRMRLRGE